MTSPEFNLGQSPLTGKNLIEASAGTGKTFTISRIFLRLLLESKLRVQQILVVTFTEAATNELKSRIHNVLVTARAAMTGQPVEDEFIQRYAETFGNKAAAEKALEAALQDFDEAGIFTIHRFCNRVLREHAFESGELFDTELVVEQTTLLLEIVEDFWRKNLSPESGLFARYAVAKLSVENLMELLKKHVGKPGVRIIPEVEPEACCAAEDPFSESYRQLQSIWRDRGEQVMAILTGHHGLNKGQYRPHEIPGWKKKMNSYLSGAAPDPAPFKELKKFSASLLKSKTNKGFTPPQHEFFDLCQVHVDNLNTLLECYDRRLLALKKSLFDYAVAELRRRKEERNIFYFDDLLFNLAAALRGGNTAIATTVRQKYSAALIDEFQDTDPLQYEIFTRIFDSEDHTLFLIGDPKQAIYGFRGADIFAYLLAKQATDLQNQFTLSQNHRSTPELISAFNTIFAGDNTFLYNLIPYQPATAAQSQPLAELTLPGGAEAPFQMWFIDPQELGANDNPDADGVTDFLVKAVVAEIVRLLNLGRAGQARYGDEALAEKHMAVLVRTNAQARMVENALKRQSVNSVLYSTSNLFESREAVEMELLLTAVAQPRRTRKVRAALATEIMGLPCEQLVEAGEDESGLEAYFARFTQYHEIWQTYGFMRMFKAFMSGESVPQRLMARPDGERRITNLLHLSEVLHAASSKHALGITGVLNWLVEQRAQSNEQMEEHQIRLESDENAVKLITMHMSKGMQYPVVFCPFTVVRSDIFGSGPLEFHDEEHGLALTLDLAHNPANKPYAEKEQLAEKLRLLYVALTRARNRCYLAWAPTERGAKTSALSYLLHRDLVLNAEDPVADLKKIKLTATEQLARAQGLARRSGGSIGLKQLRDTDAEASVLNKSLMRTAHLSARKFTSKIDASERIASYSSLVSYQPHHAELADYDAVFVPAPEHSETEPAAEVFSARFSDFPRGPKTGTFIHSVLQHCDFQESSAAAHGELVLEKLRAFGFDAEWQPAILKLLDNVLQTRLPADPSFSLSQIRKEKRLNELEFYFPLKLVSAKALRACFANLNPEGAATEFHNSLTRLSQPDFRGFMKGFIDLVFEHNDRYFVVDWKSNYLGPQAKDYSQPAMMQAMVESLYLIQYHIYTLALDRYLQVRLPGYDYEQHFGGVFYVFLRGVTPKGEAGQGVFFDRPKKDTVALMRRTLMPDSVQAGQNADPDPLQARHAG